MAREHFLPTAYLGVALVLVVALVPTALRPPNDQPPSSAEFDPNAPPDDTVESLMSSLDRGTSAAAGAGPGEDPGVEAVEEAATPPALPRGCPLGFGDPPRQTESLYAPACAPAWIGDNGGATYQGVTANEIRVAVWYDPAEAGYTGFVDDRNPADETQVDYTLRIFQTYFNRAFQLYGRKLRFVSIHQGGGRERAVRADEEFKVFAAMALGSEGAVVRNDELARRKLPSFLWWAPESFFRERAPYVWGWNADTTNVMEFAAEYVCKKLVGKRAEFAGDPLLRNQERKFGVVHVSDGFADEYGTDLKRFLNRDCGADLTIAGYGSVAADQASVAMARMRSEGVTTVALMGNFVFMATTHNAATSQGFFPEWFHTGPGSDTNTEGHLGGSQQQMANAFGITTSHITQRWSDTECVRAVRSVDPDGRQPAGTWCYYLWSPLQQLVAGIQTAGPILTPQTYAKGMFDRGYRFWDDPAWPVGGGYGPGDFTYSKDVAEMWWDPTADDPCPECLSASAPAAKGAWKFVRGGKRYKLGEIPREDSLVFQDGVTHPEE